MPSILSFLALFVDSYIYPINQSTVCFQTVCKDHSPLSMSSSPASVLELSTKALRTCVESPKLSVLSPETFAAVLTVL